MAQLIDSSVFVQLERERLPLERLAGTLGDEPVAVAAITASELLAGVYQADTAARRLRREAFVEQILAALPVVPFDLAAARVYARIAAKLRAAGLTLGAHDLQIAATALAAGCEVVTSDLRDFGRIPGLAVRTLEIG